MRPFAKPSFIDNNSIITKLLLHPTEVWKNFPFEKPLMNISLITIVLWSAHIRQQYSPYLELVYFWIIIYYSKALNMFKAFGSMVLHWVENLDRWAARMILISNTLSINMLSYDYPNFFLQNFKNWYDFFKKSFIIPASVHFAFLGCLSTCSTYLFKLSWKW